LGDHRGRPYKIYGIEDRVSTVLPFDNPLAFHIA
jgi:hypothetical protein